MKKILTSEVFLVISISVILLAILITRDLKHEKAYKNYFLNKESKKVEKVIEYVEVEKTIIVKVTPKPTKTEVTVSPKKATPKPAKNKTVTSNIVIPTKTVDMEKIKKKADELLNRNFTR